MKKLLALALLASAAIPGVASAATLMFTLTDTDSGTNLFSFTADQHANQELSFRSDSDTDSGSGGGFTISVTKLTNDGGSINAAEDVHFNDFVAVLSKLAPSAFGQALADGRYSNLDGGFDGYTGPRLFTGTNDGDPTFETGTFLLNDSQDMTGGPTSRTLTVSEVAGDVPEPATWAMMMLGFGLVGGAMRYRRRATTVRYA